MFKFNTFCATSETIFSTNTIHRQKVQHLVECQTGIIMEIDTVAGIGNQIALGAIGGGRVEGRLHSSRLIGRTSAIATTIKEVILTIHNIDRSCKVRGWSIHGG